MLLRPAILFGPLRSNSLRRLSLTSLHHEEQIATITLNHPKTRNALSIAMMQELIERLKVEGSKPETRVVVLGAEGPVFSAGHNLKELDQSAGLMSVVFGTASKLMASLIDCPVPIIAKIDGLAAAAGCQLIAQCDLAFCTKTSRFSTPGANFGIFCSTPGVALARNVPCKAALSMLFTGLPVSGLRAQEIGLVTQALDGPQALEQELKTACDAIKLKGRDVIALGKQFYYQQIQVKDVKQAFDLGGETMVKNLMLDNGQEGVRSFIEKRPAKWR